MSPGDAWRARADAAPGWLVRWVFVPLCLLLPVAAYVRLWFGVDVTDEAYYVAMAHALASGSRIYIDEFHMAQTAALELAPFVWAFERVVGSTEGLFLFVRHLFFALLTGTAALVFARLREEEVPRPVAAATAGVVFVFMPFSLPSISYNTLGALLLTIGLFAMSTRRHLSGRLEQVLAGFALGAAAFAYPPIAPAVVAACAVTWRRDRGAFLRLCAGLAVPAVVGLAILVYATPARVLEATAFLRSYGAHTASPAKVVTILRGGWSALTEHAPTGYGLALLVLAALFSRRAAALALPALALAFATRLDGALPRGQLLLAFVALLGPALRVTRESDPRSLWFVSCIAGACTSIASSNGFTNACVGLLPAFLWVVAWTARTAASGDGRASAAERGALAAGCCLVAAVLGVAQFAYVYRDAPLAQLTATMSSGPYRGLRTTPAKREFLDGALQDLATASTGRRSVFFYDGFPAGYLLTDLTPRCPTVWVEPRAHYPAADRQFFIRYFDRNEPPDVVFEHDPLGEGQPRDTADPLRARFAEPAYEVLLTREKYRVLVRR